MHNNYSETCLIRPPLGVGTKICCLNRECLYKIMYNGGLNNRGGHKYRFHCIMQLIQFINEKRVS